MSGAVALPLLVGSLVAFFTGMHHFGVKPTTLAICGAPLGWMIGWLRLKSKGS
jgi:hypothetical protein